MLRHAHQVFDFGQLPVVLVAPEQFIEFFARVAQSLLLETELIDCSTHIVDIALQRSETRVEPCIGGFARELLFQPGDGRIDGRGVVARNLLLLPPVITSGTGEGENQQKIEQAEPGAARF